MQVGIRVRPESSCGNTIAGESSEHKPDARQSDEGDGGSVEVFVVLGKAPAAVDPGDGAFHDPASWDHLETRGLRGTLDHLDPPGGRCRSRPCPHYFLKMIIDQWVKENWEQRLFSQKLLSFNVLAVL